MNIWLTIGIVYAILTLSAIVWIIVRHVKHKNAKRVDGDDDDLFGKTPALWVRILISSLLPLFVLALPFIAISVLKEMYYRNRPKPLSSRDRRLYPVYKVRDVTSDRVVTLSQYNETHKTAFTLDDVYGKGFEEKLSQKDKDAMEIDRQGLLIEDSLPNDIYTEIAKRFAFCRYNQDFSTLRPFLSENVKLIIYKRKELSGIADFESYWIDKENRLKHDCINVRTSIKFCNYYSHVAVYDQVEGYKPMCVLFRVKDDIVTHMVCAPDPLQDPTVRYWSFKRLPFAYGYIMDNVQEQIPGEPQRLPCLKCGNSSEGLVWYKVNIDLSPLSYAGVVSVCENCRKVVEFYPDVSIDNGEVQGQKTDKVENKVRQEDVFILSQLITRNLYFDNPLKDTKYFDNLDKNYVVDSGNRPFADFSACKPCSLAECAGDFNEFMLSHLFKKNIQFYNDIKTCYLQAYNDGIYEVANNIGILLLNCENNMDEGLRWLRLAASNGSKNAMQNIFSVLWGIGDLEHAIEYLLKVCEKPYPSIRCLWNLAVLYILGERQKGNTLIKDVGKGISLLNQIIEYDVLESDEKEIEEMRMKAKILVRQIKESNEYGWIGRAFHSYLKSLHEETMPPDGYNHDVLSILDELTFNGILKIHFAQHVGRGDNSWFYIDTGHSTKALEKRLLIEKVDAAYSEMSAWQIYLLTTASTVLPAFWHGDYENRQYVFSKSDISNLSGFYRENIFSKVDISNIADDILPGIELIGNIAKVRCCYWNDWKGLVRETVSINFNDKKNIRINKEIESEVLYKYNCGIRF